jgi:hypothetical protein
MASAHLKTIATQIITDNYNAISEIREVLYSVIMKRLLLIKKANTHVIMPNNVVRFLLFSTPNNSYVSFSFTTVTKYNRILFAYSIMDFMSNPAI